MVTSDDNALQVILIVSESDLVSDFQQHFAARGFTVRFAEDPSAARQAMEGQRPRLVVLPLEGACLAMAQTWARGETPADVIIGLVAQLADARSAPSSVTRTARRGQALETVSLAELLLRSTPPIEPTADSPPAAEAGEAGSPWNRPGGILKNLQLPKEPADPGEEDDGEDPDFDPSRVSDIRSLGVAVRMAKAMQAQQQQEPASTPTPSINLSHGDDAEEDDYSKPAGITDALALLPEARPAETEEETIARLAAERVSEPAAPRPTVRDPTSPALVLEPAAQPRRSRKALIIVLGAALALVVGSVTAYLLLRPPTSSTTDKGSREKKAGATPSKGSTKPKKPPKGLFVDPFAGTIARLPRPVTALDVDASDEYLNRSVPELNPYIELALRRLSRSKRRKVLLERGTKLLQWERYPEARRYLKQAVELGDGPLARAGLSRAYEGLGRTWAAIVHLKLAIKKDRKNADYHRRLGLLYLQEGKKKRGCKALRRAAKLKAGNRPLYEKSCGAGRGSKRRRRSRRRRRRP